ncbi:uncharacterized protein CANTADRAFT_321000 [Suhomyces tanzawaensis NRRL Y-17324]|uniref:Uncharacterized protein n=1 Tax=Suhomyces tanzawaensis NRRL Y-17324 TaxID=984487 RepID=A0A1E4SBW0_9ASCO|nr:uncharacterized protein CANTADRAFT_321000 [Suhomyces tanzawaensis NRRL Y-17324]ODV76975.1 hypothetical protein CANTADRAFT_321000 [Suhomyces tanzawaensis NRRL Y-17324]
MSRLTKEASQRLANLLYASTSTEVASKVPIVTKHLYGDLNTHIKSALDGLMENEWNQIPTEAALDLVPANAPKSNILQLKCNCSFLTRNDFLNLFPINRERRFLLPQELREGLKFQVVKKRDPLTLTFENAYYLIFPNHLQACIYYMETQHKAVNGLAMDFKFEELSRNKLKYIMSPFLGPDGLNLLQSMKQSNALNKHTIQNPFHEFQTPSQHISTESILKYAPLKSEILSQLLKLEVDPKSKDVNPNYELLTQLTDASTRANSVLVRNLPFGLSKHTIPRLLWDYDLVRKSPITTIVNNPVKQTHIQLIRFENSASSERFVRNFHGKKWDTMQHHQDEKKFYEPILCEIVD